MGPEAAIKVEKLSKRYRIGARQERYRSLREAIMAGLQGGLRRLARGAAPEPESIWALRDVSFEVRPGEVVGIIGRNGAGKTTLLRVLSRITEPTEGRGEIRGRVASLLEVGTGFHPELTGRENICLNGAVLGMKRAEIAGKFDRIVEFAEIERFLDTPVKRYSSGMYVRLAFAVAAHLEPEILLVDEVLAVGDAAFQSKCLGKMSDVATGGRTVLFVSHNLGAVAKLCKRSLLLHEGRIERDGPSSEVIAEYLCRVHAHAASSSGPAPSSGTDAKLVICEARIVDSRDSAPSVILAGEPFYVEIAYEVHRPICGARIGFSLFSADGTVVLHSADLDDPATAQETKEAGRYVARGKVPGGLLNRGRYRVNVWSDVPMQEVLADPCHDLLFDVEVTEGPGAHVPDGRQGVIRPLLEWETRRAPRPEQTPEKG